MPNQTFWKPEMIRESRNRGSGDGAPKMVDLYRLEIAHRMQGISTTWSRSCSHPLGLNN